MADQEAVGPPPLLERLSLLCRAVLPDCSVIVHGSLALGGYAPGKSDLDLLVLSDATTDGLVEAVQGEWQHDPMNLDLRVVAYEVAAAPTRTPRMRLYVGVHNGQWQVERDIDEPDLVVEFSVCGRSATRS